MSAAESLHDDQGPSRPLDASSQVLVGGALITADNVGPMIVHGTLDLGCLTAPQRDVVLQLAEIGRRRADAAVTLVAESARRTGSFAADGHASIRSWGAALCNWSPHQASVTNSVLDVIGCHELVRSEYLAGRLGLAQLVELARLANHPRAEHHFAATEKLLVEDAQKLCYRDFRIVCARWLLLADPDGADQDEKLRHQLRDGFCIRDRDGMVHLQGQFAGAQGAAIKEIFEHFHQAETQADFDAARSEHPDNDTPITRNDLPRSDAQCRADALYAIFLRAATTPPGAKPPVPVVNLLVDLDTFESFAHGEPIEPASYRRRRCETADGEPVAPSDIIAATLVGHIRRIVTTGASTIIDKGRRQRLFTGSAREAAKLQYPRCTYPGCGVPTTSCQIDHVQPARDDGPTAPWNAQPRCPRHNRWKEHGYRTWQDDHGHWHTIRPDGTEIQPV